MKIRRTTDNRQSGWQYLPDEHAICVPCRLMDCGDISFLPPELQKRREWRQQDLFSLLHEMGHAAHKHKKEKNPFVRQAQERQAWQYAADCLRPQYHAAMWEFAAWCMRTY